MSTELSLPVTVISLFVLALLTVLFIASTVKAFVTRRFSWVCIATASGTAATGLLGFLCLQAVESSTHGTLDSRVFRSIDGISGISAPTSWTEIPFAEGKDHFHQIRCWTPRETRETAFPD
ncbi:MAG: hypothetical protein P1V20_02605 [Verrucomicrobiales bacterium]|nr:hypothetical protein [Verrucomicrobiales bacterium]